MATTDMVDTFVNKSEEMITGTFPKKNITVSKWDKPYITEELKSLRRQRQRAYRKWGGKSKQYLRLRNQFYSKPKVEAEKYRQKILNEVLEGKRTSSYKALRKLEFAEFGEHSKNQKSFNLPKHLEESLSPLESAERLADYFSKISQSFEPVNVERFSPRIKNLLNDG